METTVLNNELDGVTKRYFHDEGDEGKDFNDYFVSGFYTLRGDKNTPDGISGGRWMLEVAAIDNNPLYVTQRAWNSNKSIFHFRARNGSTVWTEWGAFATKDDLSIHFPNADYIFSSANYPRISVIRDGAALLLRHSNDKDNYKQLRISDTGVYADWVSSDGNTVTKTITTK